MTTDATQFKTIVVGNDFSACSQDAVEMAANLAKKVGARLLVVHTFELPAYGFSGMEVAAYDWMSPMQKDAQEQLNRCVQELAAQHIDATGFFGMGAPWEQILRVATDHKADLIVIGTHGRRGVARALLGSVAEKLVRMSPIPVLTVRSGQLPVEAAAGAA